MLASSGRTRVSSDISNDHWYHWVENIWDGHSADSSYIKYENTGCKQEQHVTGIRGEKKL